MFHTAKQGVRCAHTFSHAILANLASNHGMQDHCLLIATRVNRYVLCTAWRPAKKHFTWIRDLWDSAHIDRAILRLCTHVPLPAGKSSASVGAAFELSWQPRSLFLKLTPSWHLKRSIPLEWKCPSGSASEISLPGQALPTSYTRLFLTWGGPSASLRSSVKNYLWSIKCFHKLNSSERTINWLMTHLTLFYFLQMVSVRPSRISNRHWSNMRRVFRKKGQGTVSKILLRRVCGNSTCPTM